MGRHKVTALITEIRIFAANIDTVTKCGNKFHKNLSRISWKTCISVLIKPVPLEIATTFSIAILTNFT